MLVGADAMISRTWRSLDSPRTAYRTSRRWMGHADRHCQGVATGVFCRGSDVILLVQKKRHEFLQYNFKYDDYYRQ